MEEELEKMKLHEHSSSKRASASDAAPFIRKVTTMAEVLRVCVQAHQFAVQPSS